MTLPDLTLLPKGQRRVAEALISGNTAQTYRGVAKQLELSLGTVYEHLRRIRVNHPEFYAALMEYRRGQLERRHEAALEKDATGGFQQTGFGLGITGAGHGG